MSGSSSTVLLVEDNRDLRDLTQAYLELAGFEVLVAGDGQEGVDAALAHRPGAIIVDIGLPVLDGFEVARMIRRELGRGPFLVAMTGYGRDEDRASIVEAGFDLHLVKPVPPGRIVEVLTSANRSANAHA